MNITLKSICFLSIFVGVALPQNVVGAAELPEIQSSAATDLGRTNATLRATVDPGPFETAVYFQWGASTNVETSVGDQRIAGGGVSTVSFTLDSLNQGEVYYFRAVATNEAGIHRGPIQPFVTTGPLPFLSEDLLRQNIEAGGLVTFACDGILELSSEIEIDGSVTIDGAGHQIVLSGSHSNRIFTISSGATLKLSTLTLANGLSTNGGAIYNENGTIELSHIRFENNFAVARNGSNGLARLPAETDLAGNPGTSGGSASAGAIFNGGSLFADDCQFISNGARGGDGGKGGNVASTSFASGGNGGAGGDGRGGALQNMGNATLLNVTFTENAANGGSGGDAGGGGNSGPLCTSGIPGVNGTATGGAIDGSGSLSISNAFFKENHAHAGTDGWSVGGNCSLQPPGSSLPALGGAIASRGPLSLLSASCVANEAVASSIPGSPSPENNSRGGALFLQAGFRVVNCTFVRNSADQGFQAIATESAGDLIHSTFAGDSIRVDNAPLFLVNTILQGGSLIGSFIDGGHNLSSTVSPALTNVTSRSGIDPKLGVFGDNGGPFPTLGLLPESPALGAADPLYAPSLDARGVPRPMGAGPDIGAFEGVTQLRLPTFTVSAPSKVILNRESFLSVAISNQNNSSLDIARGTVSLDPPFHLSNKPFPTGDLRFLGAGTNMEFAGLTLAPHATTLTSLPFSGWKVGQWNNRESSLDIDGSLIKSTPLVITVARNPISTRSVSITNASEFRLELDDLPQFTLSYWFKASPGQLITFLGRYDIPTAGAAFRDIACGLEASGRVAIRGRTAGENHQATPKIVRSEGAYGDGAWHHISIIQYAHGIGAVIDAEQVYLGTEVRFFVPDGGNGQSYLQFSGLLDELQIWSHATNPVFVIRDEHKALSGNEPGLIHYFNFEADGYFLPPDAHTGIYGRFLLPDSTIWAVSDAPIYDFKLMPPVRLAAGAIRLNVMGGVGQPLAVQQSSNLVSWVTIKTNEIGSTETFSFDAPSLPGSEPRFYRAVEPAP
jgi:hypothetical protein